MAASLSALAALGGCSLPLPDKPARAVLYDLGSPQADAPATARAQPLALHTTGSPALDSDAMIYRLSYAGVGAQQPRVYAQARWAMSPPQLMAERLREALAVTRMVTPSGAGLTAVRLDAELQEFAQDFSAPAASDGVLRLRATLIAPGQRLLGQRSFTARIPAPSPDAAGGAQALRQAADEVARQVAAWVDSLAEPVER